jgi:sortase A
MSDAQTWTPEPIMSDLRNAVQRRRQRQGRALRIVGVVLILAAVAVGGYVWWLLWGTGLETKAAQSSLRPGFESRIGTVNKEDVSKADKAVAVPGKPVMIIKIPKIDVDYVVVEGTDTESLKKGPGHYSDTAYPWQNHGRVGIAGHRTTYGSPFWALDKLTTGDRITLATEYGVYEYRITSTRIIEPSNGKVLLPTDHPSLVLTTCHPRFSAAERLIVFADRVDA